MSIVIKELFKNVICADIGGSHITTGIVSLTTGLSYDSIFRKAVDTNEPADRVISEIANALNYQLTSKDYQKAKSQIPIGISMPGPFDYENGISLIKGQSKFENLYNVNIKKELASQLQINSSQIRFENDAACFLLGEVLYGSDSPNHKTLGLTLGTGLGSCEYHNGNVRDLNKWDTPFDESIAENYLVTRWFTREYNRITGQDIRGVKEIIENSDNELTTLLFNKYADNLSRFISLICTNNEYENVILGGNISKAFDLFGIRLKDNLINSGLKIKVNPAKLGENSALIGAACLWNENFYKK
ncbi:ROK family protein [Marinigracilibium pacificum]